MQPASTLLPECLTRDAVEAGLPRALRSIDLLPPRPSGHVRTELHEHLIAGHMTALQAGAYAPTRAQFFPVPKGPRTTRPAGLLTLPDRITYEALGALIERRLDAMLPAQVWWPRSPHAAARPGDRRFCEAPLEWAASYIAKADVARFYERIDHSALAGLLGRHLATEMPYAQAVEEFLDTVMGTSVGLPQGPEASDVFASAYLLPIDQRLGEEGWTFLRYADDYFIAADSIVDGHDKLELLAALLRDVHLELNAEKTMVMRHRTYRQGLSVTPSIARSRAELRRLSRRLGGDDEVEEAVEQALVDETVDDRLAWDLLYHHGVTLTEAVEELRQVLTPSAALVHADCLHRLAAAVESDDLADRRSAAERLARESLAYVAAGRSAIPVADIATILRWSPRLARHVAVYLSAIAPIEATAVSGFIQRWLAAETAADWTSAWLCHVAECAPELVRRSLAGTLRQVVLSNGYGFLTRLSASRCLARADQLDEHSWRGLYRDMSAPARSELVLSLVCEPSRYPWAERVLSDSDATLPLG